VAGAKWKNHGRDLISRSGANSANRAFRSARGPSMEGSGRPAIWFFVRKKSAIEDSISPIRARQAPQAVRWARIRAARRAENSPSAVRSNSSSDRCRTSFHMASHPVNTNESRKRSCKRHRYSAERKAQYPCNFPIPKALRTQSEAALIVLRESIKNGHQPVSPLSG